MFDRFPHTVTVASAGQAPRVNGNVVAPTANAPLVFSGRYEAKPNSTIAGADGTVIAISGILYMPPTVPLLNIGMTVTVSDGTEQKAKGSVKQFERTRLNAKAWL